MKRISPQHRPRVDPGLASNPTSGFLRGHVIDSSGVVFRVVPFVAELTIYDRDTVDLRAFTVVLAANVLRQTRMHMHRSLHLEYRSSDQPGMLTGSRADFRRMIRPAEWRWQTRRDYIEEWYRQLQRAACTVSIRFCLNSGYLHEHLQDIPIVGKGV